MYSLKDKDGTPLVRNYHGDRLMPYVWDTDTTSENIGISSAPNQETAEEVDHSKNSQAMDVIKHATEEVQSASLDSNETEYPGPKAQEFVIEIEAPNPSPEEYVDADILDEESDQNDSKHELDTTALINSEESDYEWADTWNQDSDVSYQELDDNGIVHESYETEHVLDERDEDDTGPIQVSNNIENVTDHSLPDKEKILEENTHGKKRKARLRDTTVLVNTSPETIEPLVSPSPKPTRKRKLIGTLENIRMEDS
jgi:hypothetical protein